MTKRTIWIIKNLTATEMVLGFNAIQTLLDLELSFTTEEMEALNEAIKSSLKQAIKSSLKESKSKNATV